MFKSLLNWFSGAKGKNHKPEEDIIEQINQSLKDFKNRPIYKKLTTEIINNTKDDDLVQLVFDSLLKNFPGEHEKEHETLLTFSKAQQAIYIIWCLDAEVNNGGFNQYYFNSSGQFAKLTPGALMLIGAPKLADLVKRANTVYEKEYLNITRYQDGTLEGFSKSYDNNVLDKFDAEFYKISEIEDLHHLQVHFIRNNLSSFTEA